MDVNSVNGEYQPTMKDGPLMLAAITHLPYLVLKLEAAEEVVAAARGIDLVQSESLHSSYIRNEGWLETAVWAYDKVQP